ncbi:MAG: thrombospondin type-1 domain-containing protein [Sandaracinaceae bacterium]
MRAGAIAVGSRSPVPSLRASSLALGVSALAPTRWDERVWGGGNTVLVNLRTDYVAQVEFDEVRVFFALATGSEEVRTHRVGPFDYTRGERVVPFEGVPQGDHRIRVELYAGNVIVGVRTVLLSLSQDTSATVVVTRVHGGDVSRRRRGLGDRVRGRSLRLSGVHAGDAGSMRGGVRDGPRLRRNGSLRARRVHGRGSCVFGPIEGACDVGEYCNPVSGCVGGCNSGLCTDAGEPLPRYVWRAGEFGACSVSCGVGEERRDVTCVDGAGQPVEASLCPGPAPEASRSCERDRPRAVRVIGLSSGHAMAAAAKPKRALAACRATARARFRKHVNASGASAVRARRAARPAIDGRAAGSVERMAAISMCCSTRPTSSRSGAATPPDDASPRTWPGTSSAYAARRAQGAPAAQAGADRLRVVNAAMWSPTRAALVPTRMSTRTASERRAACVDAARAALHRDAG